MKFLQKLNIKENKTLLLAFLGLGIVILLVSLLSPSEKNFREVEAPSERFDVDTIIPAGHLLIPIQLTNAESVASLAGSYALIDLYSTNEKSRKGFKVASSLKLLRAPLNPEQFAVLVREEESANIVARDGPFFAALKNPKENQKKISIQTKQKSLIIHYGE